VSASEFVLKVIESMPTTITQPKALDTSSRLAAERSPLPKFVLACLLFLTLNAVLSVALPVRQKQLTKEKVLHAGYESLQRGPWSWWIARAFFMNQPAHIVLMGDSQMNAAIFQADAMTSGRPVDTVVDHEGIALESRLRSRGFQSVRVVNLASSGSFASDQFFISQALFPSHPPAAVIVGVSPRFFIDKTLLSPSSTECFKFFAPYVEFAALENITFADAFDRLGWMLEKYMPLRRLNDGVFSFLGQIADHLSLTANSNGTALPTPVATNEAAASPNVLKAICTNSDFIGRRDFVVKPVHTHSYVDNSGEYVHRYFKVSTRQYVEQMTFFCQYVAGLRAMGTRVIVIGMPSLAKNRILLPDSFWTKFKEIMATDCRHVGAEWYDLTDDTRFSDQSLYLDNVHLNQDGGLLLTKILAGCLVDSKTR
jgi:hypothetical protein